MNTRAEPLSLSKPLVATLQRLADRAGFDFAIAWSIFFRHPGTRGRWYRLSDPSEIEGAVAALEVGEIEAWVAEAAFESDDLGDLALVAWTTEGAMGGAMMRITPTREAV